MVALDDLEIDAAGRIVGAYRFGHRDPAFVGYLGAAYFDGGTTDWLEGPQLRDLVLRHGAALDHVDRRPDDDKDPA